MQARAAAKLAEVEAKLADLAVIRDTLRAALAAGCDDLMTCAETDCCPLPFVELAAAPGAAAVTARPARRGRWWQVLPAGLAGLSCAACCALPVLIAAGLLAGGGTVGAVLRWLPGAAAALAAVAVVVFLLPARRNHARGCAAGRRL